MDDQTLTAVLSDDTFTQSYDLTNASPSHLALTVARTRITGADPLGQGRRAMELLSALVTRLARATAGRFPSLRWQTTRDFVETAPEEIWCKVLKFYSWYNRHTAQIAASQGTDPFVGWCRKVLKNRCKDLVRRQMRLRKHEALNGSEACDHRLGRVGEAPAERFELSPTQLAQIRQWDATDALIAFSLGGQWSLVPRDLWAQWLAEANVEGQFPSAEFLAAPRNKKRGILVEALGISRNTLDQRWHRLTRHCRQASRPARLAS